MCSLERTVPQAAQALADAQASLQDVVIQLKTGSQARADLVKSLVAILMCLDLIVDPSSMDVIQCLADANSIVADNIDANKTTTNLWAAILQADIAFYDWAFVFPEVAACSLRDPQYDGQSPCDSTVSNACIADEQRAADALQDYDAVEAERVDFAAYVQELKQILIDAGVGD